MTRSRRLSVGQSACLAAGVCMMAAAAQGSELVIGPGAMQNIVVSSLFTDHGRWDLMTGSCYAHLETPRASLAHGRVILNARLSAKVGLDVGDSCVGSAIASNVQLSGRLAAAGSQIALQDIRIDRVDDEATRQALELLQSATGGFLPRAVTIELTQLLTPTVLPEPRIRVVVTGVTIASVVTQPDNVIVHFDISLTAT